MRTRILPIVALVALLFAPSPATAHILPMTDAMSVMDAVHEQVAHSDDLDISIVAEGVYAIAFWKAENGHVGGAALVKETAGDWRLVKLRTSQFTHATELQALGVPTPQANALLADLRKANEE